MAGRSTNFFPRWYWQHSDNMESVRFDQSWFLAGMSGQLSARGLGSPPCWPLHMAAWASLQHGGWVTRKILMTDKLYCASSYKPPFTSCIPMSHWPKPASHMPSPGSVWWGLQKDTATGSVVQGPTKVTATTVFHVSFTSGLPGVSFPVSSSVLSFLFLKTMYSLAR